MTTTRASTGVDGFCQRTTDRSRPPESEKVKPKTATQILADAFLADHERRQAEDRAEEERKAEEWRQREEKRRADAERAAKRAAFLATDVALEEMYQVKAATQAEIATVNNHVAETVGMDASVDIHRAALMTLRANGRL